MADVHVKTGVDDLINYLRTKGKVSLKEASEQLKIPETTLQLWLDFLVEERIVGMEYKFTKPFIFLNEEDTTDASNAEKDKVGKATIDTFKEEFFSNAKQKEIPESKILSLWQNHLSKEIDKQKEFFLLEANKRAIENPERVFGLYKRRLIEM